MSGGDRAASEQQSRVIPFEELLRGEFRIEPGDREGPYLVATGPDGRRELELQEQLVEKLGNELKEAEALLSELKSRQ
jgi:hypothetical protein